MKKFYLFMLMAVGLLVSGNAGADNVCKIGETPYESLQAAFDAAENGDVIKLTVDINFASTTEAAPNITKSITLDGQGFSITGYGANNAQGTYTKGPTEGTIDLYPALTINQGGESVISVTIQNLIMDNTYNKTSTYSKPCVIKTCGNIGSLTIKDCKISCSEATGYGLAIGGYQETNAVVNMDNTVINLQETSKINGYPIVIFNPITLTMTDCQIVGYCGIYFKGTTTYPNYGGAGTPMYGGYGSRGTIVKATNCEFDEINLIKDINGNGFSILQCEDSDLDITLEDCGFNINYMGSTAVTFWSMSEAAAFERRADAITIRVKGNNTHVYGSLISDSFLASWDGSNDFIYPEYKYLNGNETNKKLIIEGGTFSDNPKEAVFPVNYYQYLFEYFSTPGNDKVNCVPEGYEVSTVQQLGSDGNPVTLYRVHPKTAKDEHGVSYVLNDDVETKGGGQNPNTSFLLSADETVAADMTYAEYVEIQSGKITIPEGKTLSIGEGGLVIQEGGALEIQPGGTVTVSKGGAITASEENIVIKSNNASTGSYLLDPVVTFNQQPKATVKMTASIGKMNASEYKWHRFAIPVEKLDAAWTKSPERGTYLYEWSYEAKDWVLTVGGSEATKPFLGYTITTANEGVENVEYTFVGNLVGNVPSGIDFTKHGYGYFGNSYTGYMLAKVLLQNVMGISGVAGTVWMWNPNTQTYSAVSLADYSGSAAEDLAEYEKEVAPMQTFILLLNSGAGATINIDYESAIWGNPRYGLVAVPTAAPANKNNYDDAYIRFNVSSASGQTDFVRMTENANNTDEYENGVDATKYMNSNNINLYSTVAGENYTSLYTNNLEGKTLTLQAGKDVNYTLTIGHVEGSDYALEDMLTGNIIPLVEGQTYEFAAQPNETTERFMVVAANKAPTKLNQVVNAKAAKGIYTPLGQYLGESSQWENLPSGIYMIDGVKIVK